MARLNTKTSVTSKVYASRPSPAELYKLIKKKAYELFQKRGCTYGNSWADWFEAEKLIKKSYNIK